MPGEARASSSPEALPPEGFFVSGLSARHRI